MREHGGGELHDDAAERLIRDAAAGRCAGDDPLASLLRAAAAPARPAELAGRAAAVAAFRAAHPGAPAAPAGAPAQLSKLRRLLVMKIAAAVAAVAVAGVALASATGLLPDLLDPAPSTAVTPTRPAPGTSPPPPPAPDVSATVAVPGKSVGPEPSVGLRGLCEAYLREPDNGKALENPAYASLIAAAGRAGNVTSFCNALLVNNVTPSPTKKPSHTQPSRNAPTR